LAQVGLVARKHLAASAIVDVDTGFPDFAARDLQAVHAIVQVEPAKVGHVGAEVRVHAPVVRVREQRDADAAHAALSTALRGDGTRDEGERRRCQSCRHDGSRP